MYVIMLLFDVIYMCIFKVFYIFVLNSLMRLFIDDMVLNILFYGIFIPIRFEPLYCVVITCR